MKYIKLLVVAFCAMYFVSCRTQQKSYYNYLENMRDTTSKVSVVLKEPIIQKNDLISIQIFSSAIDPALDAPFNLGAQSGNQSQVAQQTNFGYLVDVSGNIEYPRLGTLHVEGLSKSQLIDLIKSRLQGKLADPSVIIRFLNFRITMMGEVGSPGTLTIPTERLTILEALGMAGDITEFGKKKSVRVLRENNGVREIGTIDLTEKEMFQSPYYQLQQNDVVLVEQTRYKLRQRDQQRVSQQLGFALSIITSIALLYNIFK